MSATHAAPSRSLSGGIIIAVVSAITFAASGPFGKLLLEAGWSAGGLVLLRVLFSSLVLLPLVIWSVRRDPGVLLRRWLWIVAYGCVAVAMTQLFYFLAAARLQVGIALIIEFLAPVLLLFAVWVRTRVRPGWLALLGAAFAVFGLLFVLSPSGSAALDPIGLVWASCAAVSLAIYFLLSANAPADLPPIALIGCGLLVATAVLGLLGAVGVLPIEVVFSQALPFFGTTVPWWVPLGLVVFVGTVCGYGLGLIAAIRLGSRLASFLGLIEVVAVVVIAALLLGEIPTILQAFGALLIVGGVVAVRLSPERTPLGKIMADEAGTMTGPIHLPFHAGHAAPEPPFSDQGRPNKRSDETA